MQTMPRKAVYAAASIVFIAALVGLYVGVGRSLGSPAKFSGEEGAIVSPVTPVASAKPILTPTQTMDEAEVRKLAREEAQALFVKAAPRKTPVEDDTDDSSVEQLTPVAPPASSATAKPKDPPPQG